MNLSVSGAGPKYYASPYAYVTEVTNVLRTLRGPQTGRALFDEIGANLSHKIAIAPWEGSALDATSIAAKEANAIPVGSSEGSGKGRIDGVGGGGDVTVSCTPGRFSAYCQLWNPVALGDGYDNEEEFLAIMAANVYTSERGRPGDLRRNRQTNFHLTEDTDAAFLPKADQADYRFRVIGKFIQTQPRLAFRLSAMPAAFNPVRRHLQLQGRMFAVPFGRTPFPTIKL